MKKSIIAMIFIAAFTFSTQVEAQKFSGLDKSPADIVYFKPEKNAPPMMKVIYSRPQLKGRTVGTDLAPYGSVWRTGANEATEIKFYQDVSLGGKPIPAGTYSLFTIPGKDKWTVIINKDVDVWGAYSYNEGNDVARIEVPAGSGNKSLEAFSIAFEPMDDGAKMIMGWDKLRVEVPITKSM
ncbi:DUF2911 domain-containing protein [Galbibacter mesophilus]|uniref:DUF2911 domain-containing protein n=1 Tax=Galbibacter mesophilus TaxID=379069 RepID=UPI00191CC2D3|nr:DUF2911 domain-containing protein [Galbibacter mesophilus]MCM5661577.1 DUF2911 domain-containing protein [Galbibacter mesophilus]